ncbi:MAG: hypothetical protein Q7T05_01695 [Dehalococcoidia bacterium]|nr:hypothetical protein [Dehalococcoidia bacterium]
MDKNKSAAIIGAVNAYLQLEAEARTVAAAPSGPACSPWSLFGRIGIMRNRDFSTGRGRRGGAGGASSFEASAVRNPR